MRATDPEVVLPRARSADPSQAAWAHIYEEIALPVHDLADTLQRIADEMSSLVSSTVSIFLAGQDGLMHPLGVADPDPERTRQIRQVLKENPPRLGQGIIGRVAERRESMFVHEGIPVPSDAFETYEAFKAATGLNSFLSLPLLMEGRMLGVLGVSRFGAQAPIAEDEIPTLQRLADMISRLILMSFLAEHGRVAEAALDAIPEAVIALDERDRVTFWSAGAERLFGHHASDALGRTVMALLGPGAAGPVDSEVDRLDHPTSIPAPVTWERRTRLMKQSGEEIPVQLRGVRVGEPPEGSQEPGSVLVVRDIEAELRAEQELRQQERLAQAALDASPMMTAVVAADDVILAASAEWDRRIGPDMGKGTDICAAIGALFQSEPARELFCEHLSRVRQDGLTRSHRDYEVRISREIHTFSMYLTFMSDVGVAITVEDITERAARERALSFEATHDLLTKLPNRSVLLERSAAAIARAAANGTKVGLMFCDIDGFKELNDVYGHDIGDGVLGCFAERLEASCRSSDTVARLHGDEFAVLVENSVDNSTVQAIARRIVASLVQPIATPAGPVHASISVGAVVFEPESGGDIDSGDVEALLAQADAAMYEAKRRGKNRWVMYDEMLRAREERTGALRGELHRAVLSGEFGLHLQPQTDTDGALLGAQARIFWNHPERGPIQLSDAESDDSSLPVSVELWLMRRTTTVLGTWQHMLPPAFRLSLRLSRRQWLDRNTPGYLVDWLRRNEVSGSRLRVALSQEALWADLDWTRTAVEVLEEQGVQVVVTGLGSGNTRLTDLVRSRVQGVELSQDLVRSATAGGQDQALLEGCVELGHALGWQVFADGVDSENEMAAVRDFGCDAVAGEMVGPMLPEAEFAARYLGASEAEVAAVVRSRVDHSGENRG